MMGQLLINLEVFEQEAEMMLSDDNLFDPTNENFNMQESMMDTTTHDIIN